MNRSLPAPARDVALLLARLLLGTIMFAHGYQKLMIDGLGRTTQGFESMSIPVAIISAAFVTVIEIVGAVLVVLGALLTVVAAAYLVVMVGAAVFVHISHGIFVANGGWELVGAIAALLLALAAAGSGRFGVDHVIRSRQSAAAPTPFVDAPTPPGGVPSGSDPFGSDPFGGTPAGGIPAGGIPAGGDPAPAPAPSPSLRSRRPRPWPAPSRSDHRP